MSFNLLLDVGIMATSCHCMPDLHLLAHELLSRVQCPIMARKFSQETAATIAALLAQCGNHLNIVTSAKCEQFRRLLHVL